jgi:hypothetical protein
MSERRKCKATLLRALQGRPMTIPELMEITGHPRERITEILCHEREFERIGVHHSGQGQPSAIYRLVQSHQPPPPSPLERLVNPVVVVALHNHLDLGRMIRRMATNGEHDAAHALIKVWAKDDRELKNLCERSEQR